jgi:hypothetical protein
LGPFFFFAFFSSPFSAAKASPSDEDGSGEENFIGKGGVDE